LIARAAPIAYAPLAPKPAPIGISDLLRIKHEREVSLETTERTTGTSQGVVSGPGAVTLVMTPDLSVTPQPSEPIRAGSSCLQITKKPVMWAGANALADPDPDKGLCMDMISLCKLCMNQGA